MNDVKTYEEREPAIDIAKRSEAVGGGGEPFPSRRPKIVPPPEEPLGPSISDIARERAVKIAERRSHVLTIASLAREANGHSRHSFPPAVATMIWTMAEMATVIMDTPAIDLPVALRQTSPAADTQRAQDVADAMNGGEAA